MPLLQFKKFFISPSGNDANDGLSPSTAWQTIAKVNAGVYNPGDTILFQGEATFTGTLALTTANCLGTASNPVTIATYGGGQATIAGGASSALTATSVGGWTVNNLTLTSNVPNSAGSPAIIGVIAAVFNTTGRKDGVKITNCTISGGLCGINFTAAATDATYGCTNIEISGNTISGATEFGIYFEEAAQGTAFKHFSGVWVHDNYIHDITGDSVVTTASGNGMVLSECDQTIAQRIVDGITFGTVIEYNRVDKCGVAGVSGNQPGGIYGENSNGVLIQWNIVSNQKAKLNDTSDSINIGADTSDQWIVQYNLIFNGHDGIKIDGPASPSSGNFRHTIRYNVLVNNVRPDTTGMQIGTNIAGGNREASGASQYVRVYGNTILCDPTTFTTVIGTFGTAWQVWDNIIYNPGWLGVQYADAKLPTVVGNLYWCINNSGGRAGFYNYNTTAHAGTLAAAQALGFEKIGSTLYGIIADPLIPWSSSILNSAPTNPRQLAWYFQFAPPAGSAAFGGGVNINTNYGIATGAQDLAGVAPASNIGAYGVAISASTLSAGALLDKLLSLTLDVAALRMKFDQTLAALTPQQSRDAMLLSPTSGSIPSDSIDGKLGSAASATSLTALQAHGDANWEGADPSVVAAAAAAAILADPSKKLITTDNGVPADGGNVDTVNNAVTTDTGDGTIPVDENTTAIDNTNMLVTEFGEPVPGAVIRVWLKSEYTANPINPNIRPKGKTVSKDDGTWRDKIFVDPGSYIVGVRVPNSGTEITKEISVGV